MTQEHFKELEKLSKELSEQIEVCTFSEKMIERERILANKMRGINVLSAEQADKRRLELQTQFNSAEARITQIVRELSSLVHI